MDSSTSHRKTKGAAAEGKEERAFNILTAPPQTENSKSID
jgi:hypothetical protein